MDRMAKSKKRHNSYQNEFKSYFSSYLQAANLLTVIIYSKLSEILSICRSVKFCSLEERQDLL